MKTIRRQQTSISYHIHTPNHPDNGTILFLHGLGLDHTAWNYMLPYFLDYRVLTYDLRGHGYNHGQFAATDEENWQLLMEDTVAILQQEHIQSFHIVAHGIGAQLAIELIIRKKVTPKTFAVLSTPFYYPDKVAEEGIEFRKEKLKGMTGENLGEWMAPQLLHDVNPEKHRHIANAFTRVDMTYYLELLLLNVRAISLEKLTRISVPTLLLNGEYDVNYPPELTSISARYIPDCQTEIIREASNMVFVDQPEKTAGFIKTFHMKYSKASRNELHLPYLDKLYHELSANTPSLCRVDFLTIFRMTVNGKEVKGKWNQRKAKELLAFLAYYGKSAKDKIYARLWPESSINSAQNSLRVSIHHLRLLLKENGIEEFIFSDMEYVWINERLEINCDVKEAFAGERSLPSTNQLFSDLPVDWILELQYELEKHLGIG
ncbi:alpha/beta hydrolase [Ornithinibacillus xuwenensis]|uniref:Alpha/beta fold hydrolase n=1 Tax=Ornithinibacillus xuwenensis TaxID=3144668 RepID=A0ABU9XIL5_9BACI